MSERLRTSTAPCTRNGLFSVMKGICNDEGIDHFSYFSSQYQGVETKAIIETTHCDEWLKRYHDKHYAQIDPVIRVGFQSFLPIDWIELSMGSAIVKSFFGEAAEFGVCPNGLTIPIRDERNGRALFSVNTSMNLVDWESFKARRSADLSYLAFLFHEKTRSFYAHHRSEDPSVQLSDREKEVLLWASEGKTAWETSVILGVSKRTIDFYLRNACSKLRTATKTQAVTRAIALGQIRI
nr:LuxR family transcriptional regulator [uncultured Tateyamaria sp.]